MSKKKPLDETLLACQRGARRKSTLPHNWVFAIPPDLIGDIRFGSLMSFHFFSYGPFARGQVHFGKFSNLIQSQKPAFVKADLYRLRCGYPILNLNDQGDLIEGVLYELDAPDSFWPIFDELLGVDLSRHDKCFLNRFEIDVMVDNFSKSQAWTYGLNPKKIIKAYPKIREGIWSQDMDKKPSVLDQLQPRHKDYIAKLSKLKGRDIVPIKLDLYRELMSMELIVDKGRRLALTPLGKEVSLFL